MESHPQPSCHMEPSHWKELSHHVTESHSEPSRQVDPRGHTPAYIAKGEMMPKAKGPAKRNDGPNPGTIFPPKNIWHPTPESKYVNPDNALGLLSGMDIIFKDFGRLLWKNMGPLPPQDDIINFDVDVKMQEFEQNVH